MSSIEGAKALFPQALTRVALDDLPAAGKLVTAGAEVAGVKGAGGSLGWVFQNDLKDLGRILQGQPSTGAFYLGRMRIEDGARNAIAAALRSLGA